MNILRCCTIIELSLFWRTAGWRSSCRSAPCPCLGEAGAGGRALGITISVDSLYQNFVIIKLQ